MSCGDTRVTMHAYSNDFDRRYAVELGKEYFIELMVNRTVSVIDAEIAFYRYKSNDIEYCMPMQWIGHKKGKDIYFVSFDNTKLGVGLYTFLVKINTPEGVKYVKTGVDENGWLVDYVPFEKTKQLLIYKRNYPVCKWIEGGVIYQIFVDRFNRGKDTPLGKDAVLNSDWDNGIPQYPDYPGAPLKNNMFFGGNLSGIIEKIPYLSTLGVNCIYLSPICKAASNHKYDTGDYFSIDPSFGDDVTFRELLEKAHQAGMRIILDGVFNHTGDDSVYFNKYGNYPTVGAYQSKDSPYNDWYYFKDFPDKYECWWDISILPKLNLSNSEVREYFLSCSGVLAHYLELGADGFRLDVADELDDAFIASAKERLCSFGEDKILFGEVWEDASSKEAYGQLKRYYWGNELDGVMNYPLRKGLVNFIKDGETSSLLYALETVYRNAPMEIANSQMNFLGTHDTERILSALSNVSFDHMSNDEIAFYRLPLCEREEAIKRLKIAYVALATLPGVVMLFYGDEMGMEGYKDPFNRLPFPWNKGDQNICAFMQILFSFRRNNAIYKNGKFQLIQLTDSRFVFARTDDSNAYITAINRDKNSLHLNFDCHAETVFPSNKIGQNIIVPPMSAAVIKVNRNAKFHLF